MTKEELYRQHFLFWQSWQVELENSLAQKTSLKKKVDCAQEALKNLINMKNMLVTDVQKNLDMYINKTIELLASIKDDIYGLDNGRNLHAAELIKSGIHQGLLIQK